MQIILLIFLASLLIQVVFLLALDRGFRRHNNPVKTDDKPISVIISARNEAENLDKLLPDLLAQDYPKFEVIIVDDRSSDQTSRLVWEYKSDERLIYIESKEIPEGFNPKKWALKQGIERAAYDRLLFTDADIRVYSKDWIREMSMGFAEGKDIVLGVSPYLRNNTWLNLFIRYETLYTAFQYCGLASIGRPYMGVGRNLGYRKELFDDYKGFSGITGGDDDLQVNRMANADNVSLVLSEKSLTYSYPETTIRDFLNQKIRHLSVGKYYRSKDLWILGMFSVTQILVWLTGIYFLVFGQFALPGLLGWFTRWIFLTLAFDKALERMGVKFEVQYLVFLDFVYPLYYLSTAFAALWAKKTQWREKDNSRIRLSKTSG